MAATKKRQKSSENPLPLARKTIDTLHVVEAANTVLKEKYQSNCDLWLDSVFEVLHTQNAAYLRDESRTPEKDVFACLHNEVLNTFRGLSGEHNETFTQLSSSLVYTFGTFINMLLRCDDTASTFVTDELLMKLRQLKHSIETYTKNADTPAVNASRREKLADPVYCGECKSRIPTFNGDPEYSRALHMQGETHAKVLAGKLKPVVDETYAIRTVLNWRLKEHSICIDIISSGTFRCALCECNIDSLRNVESHVKGKNHVREFTKPSANEREYPPLIPPKILSKIRAVTPSSTNGSEESQSSGDSSHEKKLIKKALAGLFPDDVKFLDVWSAQEVRCTLCDCCVKPVENVASHVTGKNHLKKLKNFKEQAKV